MHFPNIPISQCPISLPTRRISSTGDEDGRALGLERRELRLGLPGPLRVRLGEREGGVEVGLGLAKLANFARNNCKICKFWAGSFSAVSKRIFARKYAFDSIFQALQDLHPFAPLQSQNFRKKSV